MPPRLSAPRKAVFSLGDHTVNVALSSLSLVLFTFLTKVAGLDPWLAGLLVWTARFVDAVSDPLMGRISDATRWRLGRRRPYFLLGAGPFGICFALLWTTPFTSQAAIFGWHLACYVGLVLSMTVLSVPYMALIPEMARGYDERTSLNSFRSAAAVVGTMVAACFIDIADSLGGGAQGFARAGFLLAIWLVVPWPAVFAASFESATAASSAASSLRASLRGLLEHRSFLRLCLLYVSARIAVDILGLAIPLYLIDVLGRRGDISITLLTMLGVVVLSLPFWLRVARRTDKHVLFVFGSAWFAACLVLMYFVTPQWPHASIFVIAAMLGLGYAVADLMPWAMLGEVIDEGELLSGERREGLYNGVFTFLRKLGGASAFVVAGFALELAGHGAGDVQPAAALVTLHVLATLCPAAFLGVAIAIGRRYRLGRARHAAILAELELRRAALLSSAHLRFPAARHSPAP